MIYDWVLDNILITIGLIVGVGTVIGCILGEIKYRKWIKENNK